MKKMFPSSFYDLAMLNFDYRIHLYIKNIEHFTLKSLKSLAFLLFWGKISPLIISNFPTVFFFYFMFVMS